MRNILMSVLIIGIVLAMMGAGTFSYFSDVETSKGNTFSAGVLDLNVDGKNENVVRFTVSNMRPGNQPRGHWNLSNVGTIDGYLDLEDITVTSYENGCLDPEEDAGDTTGGNPGEGNGELQDLVNVRLFVDYDRDGWIDHEDKVFYNGKVGDLPSSIDLNEPIKASESIWISAIFDWWSTPNDDIAQTDSFVLDITFELAQTEGQ